MRAPFSKSAATTTADQAAADAALTDRVRSMLRNETPPEDVVASALAARTKANLPFQLPAQATPPAPQPAAQVQYNAAPAPPPTPAEPVMLPPTGTAAPQVQVAPDGRIVGVDGMLHQIAGALADEAGPMIRRDVLPAVLADRELQAQVGRGAGESLARPLWVLTGVVTAYLGWCAWREWRRGR